MAVPPQLTFFTSQSLLGPCRAERLPSFRLSTASIDIFIHPQIGDVNYEVKHTVLAADTYGMHVLRKVVVLITKDNSAA